MNEVTLVGIIAGLSILAAAVLSYRQKRRTGRWPSEVVGYRPNMGWFSCLLVLWFCVRLQIPGIMLKKFPLFILVPGFDLTMFIALAVLAGFAFKWAFGSEWHWKTGLWITFMMLLPALVSGLVIADILRYMSMPWIWILAALMAVFLSPHLARLAYVEYYASRVSVASNTSDTKIDIIR